MELPAGIALALCPGEAIGPRSWAGAGWGTLNIFGEPALLDYLGDVFGETMRNSQGIIGDRLGSVGVVTVDNGGEWVNTGALTIGDEGTGTLNIFAYYSEDMQQWYGGVSNDATAFVGRSTGGYGTVNVESGPWECNSSLYVTRGSVNNNSENSLIEISGDLNVGASGQVNVNAGTLEVLGGVSTVPGGQLNLAGGKLSTPFPTFAPAYGTFHWTSGEFDCRNTDVTLDDTEALQELSVGAGSQLTAVNDLYVSTTGETTLTISGGGTVGNVNTYAGVSPGALAAIELSGAGTQWNNTGSVYLGGDATTTGGEGMIDIASGAAMTVGGVVKVWDDSFVFVHGGVLTSPALEVAGYFSYSGSLDLSGAGLIGAFTLAGGTVNSGTIRFPAMERSLAMLSSVVTSSPPGT